MIEAEKRVASKAVWLASVALWAMLVAPLEARTTLKTICRVKGQEENTLQGLGMVVGLKGTGDGASSLPTLRSLAQAMQFMGSPLGKNGLAELKDAKNVALVIVTATVPAAGARQGDRLDCQVSSIGAAKSLAGGRLFTTLLLGPDPRSPRVYATAEGWVTLDNPSMPTSGRVRNGCRLEEDFFNPFVKDGKITLVLDKNYADFQVAQDVADLINSGKLRYQSSHQPLARAINQNNIEVQIPQQYLADNDPVDFVSQVLGLEIPEPQVGARVVINERAGSIVIGDEVEIGAAVVSHKNIVVEIGPGAAGGGRFVPLDPSQVQTAKLKSLVESLNALHVSTEDMIEIIKGLERNGKLHAQLIIE